MGFKSMKKMETTEPSVDEVGKGMKSGGKPKMAMGGAPMGKAPMGGALSSIAAQNARKRPASAAEMATKRPRGAALMRSAAMSRPAPGIPAQAMGRVKDGGSMKKVEKEIRNEKDELHRVDERLNRHEAKAASKAHKGLKTGGIAGYKTGGIIQKFATGGVVNGAAGYKDGGFAKVACKDGGGFKAMKKGNC
jgi:hypothetical protein